MQPRDLLLVLGVFALPGCFLFGGDDPADDDDSAADDDDATDDDVPTAVDEACGTVADAGDPAASEGAIEGLVRINCYRRLLGLDEVRMLPVLNRTAQAHADYLDATDEYGHQETNTAHPAYTGEWVGDRAEAAGFVWDAVDTNVQEVVAFKTSGADAAFAVDIWIHSVYHRVPLLHPQMDSVGIGQAGIYDVMVLATAWEGQGENEFVVFPEDGQFGVPRSFDSDTEAPDPSPLGVVGYPISVTVHGPWVGDFSDPYGIQLDAGGSSLVDGDGDALGFALLQPANDASLQNSAFLLPDAPMTANSSYTATIAGQVGGQPFSRTITFETGR